MKKKVLTISIAVLALMLAVQLLVPGLIGTSAVQAETTEEAPTAVPAATEIPAEEPAELPDGSTVLATAGETVITVDDAEYYAYLLYYYGYTEDYPDYDQAIDYLVQQAVINKHVHDAGYDVFTEEEQTAFQNEAAAEFEEMLNDYVESYLTEDTAESRATLHEQAIEYYNSLGYTQQSIADELMLSEARERLEADLANNYLPTDEEIDDVFQLYGAQYQQAYEGNVAMYEYYTQYYGYESWYVPEGYRSVIHILLEADDELLTAFIDAQSAWEEVGSDENADAETLAAAKTALDEARAAVIASRQDDIDAIYTALEQGESFQNLIAAYGTDPGMQDEATLAAGYQVHPESILYDSAFTEGAFQEKMQMIGDVSDPVVSQFGIHILYYLNDVPGGLIMTDEIRGEIEEYLISDQLNSAYAEAYSTWLENIEITYDEEAINALKASAVQ
ncbi:MAG: peptidylprolyl isomerase [Clostridia bacterium]|nr:peptidylprolyl isomerase [Clostridia bacterium]